MKKLTATLLTILLLIPVTWAQERAIKPVKATAIKQALVIGNANYSHAGRLRNPVNDARAIGSTLEELGFQVTMVTDASQRKMDQAIRRFGKDLQSSNGVGLFYYAGHGMQIEGENYLLPTDINPSNEFDVTYDAVPVGKLLGQMEVADNGMNVVILDACRNNPFARSFRSNSRGLAQVIAPTGTFISYATAPGSIAADGEGDNGLFTAKLLEHMTTPGLRLEEVFKRVRADVQRESNNQQVPWDSSSLIGDFYFVTEEEEKLAALSAPVLDPEVERTEIQPIAPKEQKSASQVVQPGQKILSGSLAKEKLLATKECVACNLSSSNLVRLDLHKSNLEGANLSQASLWEANLEAANLQQSNLKGANLSYANLAGANLSKVDLNQAYLSNTNLRGVDLRGANLWKANLEFTNFDGALLCSTTMPDGEISNRDCETTEQAVKKVGVVLSGEAAKKKLLETNECVGCDLFEINLDNIALKNANLELANLEKLDMFHASLRGANLIME